MFAISREQIRATWSRVIDLGTPCNTTELCCLCAGSATRRNHCPKLGNVIVPLA